MARTKPNETPSAEWTPAQRKAIEIEATNFGPGKKTQDEIAAELGIGRTTLYEWRQLPGWDEERARLTDSYTAAHRPAVMNAMIESAQVPGREGAADRRLFFQIIGLLSQDGVFVKTETHVHNDSGDRTLAPEDVFRRLAAENGGGVDRLVRRLSDGREN